MPLTSKGNEIMSNMQDQYGSAEKAKQVFYASKNKGTIKGVDEDTAQDYTMNNYIVREGFEAASKGKPDTTNPYPRGGEPWERWKVGFNMKTLAGESGGNRAHGGGEDTAKDEKPVLFVCDGVSGMTGAIVQTIGDFIIIEGIATDSGAWFTRGRNNTRKFASYQEAADYVEYEQPSELAQDDARDAERVSPHYSQEELAEVRRKSLQRLARIEREYYSGPDPQTQIRIGGILKRAEALGWRPGGMRGGNPSTQVAVGGLLKQAEALGWSGDAEPSLEEGKAAYKMAAAAAHPSGSFSAGELRQYGGGHPNTKPGMGPSSWTGSELKHYGDAEPIDKEFMKQDYKKAYWDGVAARRQGRPRQAPAYKYPGLVEFFNSGYDKEARGKAGAADAGPEEMMSSRRAMLIRELAKPLDNKTRTEYASELFSLEKQLQKPSEDASEEDIAAFKEFEHGTKPGPSTTRRPSNSTSFREAEHGKNVRPPPQTMFGHDL